LHRVSATRAPWERPGGARLELPRNNACEAQRLPMVTGCDNRQP
jgi:hypothetical protein